MNIRCVTILTNIHMSNQHKGLRKLIRKEADLDLNRLPPGHVVLCINTKGTAAKLVGPGGHCFAYLRLDGKLSQAAIENVSRMFGGRGIELSGTVKRALVGLLGEEAPRARVAA